MNPHAKPQPAPLRLIREEWDALLAGCTLTELGDLLGVPASTVMRRNEKDDRFNSWPAEDLLAIAYAMRKRFPGFHQALVKFFDRQDYSTRILSASARAAEAQERLLDAAKELQVALSGAPLKRQDVRELRQQWALTIHSMNQLLQAAETEAMKEIA